MKDLRGITATTVRNAIFRIFGMTNLPPINKKKNPKEISQWKTSAEVAACYEKLYTCVANNTFYINHIARTVFPTLSDAALSIDHCGYTAAVCDIVLNPSYPDIECAQAPLKRRMKRFKVISVLVKNFAIDCDWYWFLLQEIFSSNARPTREDSVLILEEELREAEAKRSINVDDEEEEEQEKGETSGGPSDPIDFSVIDNLFEEDEAIPL